MNALLTAIVLWLSANFDLPAVHDHPRVEFAPAAKIVALRYPGLLADHNGRLSIAPEVQVISVYEDATKTIYLPEGWTGSTPAELSILVHEMVHHLQNARKMTYSCPQQREELAFKAQERWLRLFGSDLMRDFAIDAFTLLVRTKCLH